MLQPDPSQALSFFKALFPQGGLLHFRSVPEPKDGRDARNHHYQLDENFGKTLADFLSYCVTEHRAAFFLPGVVALGGTGKADVLSLTSVLADFDKGDPASNLAAIEAAVGPASIVLESGGHTADGKTKLHAYWLLEQPATQADIATVCAIRETIAKDYGGDHAFKQAAQVIRIPGSIHFKKEPRRVETRHLSLTQYPLSLFTARFRPRTIPVLPADPWLYFGDAHTVQAQLDRALTSPVHAEGRDDITRFEAAGSAIGHFVRMIRDGKLSEDQAWQAACDWNQATLVPPWGEDRLRNDFERMRRIDVETHGAITPVTPVLSVAPASGWAVGEWRADRFQGEPPQRRWLIEGVIPAAYPGLLAAVGDAGKSMMALQLALIVATYPVPQNAMLGFNDTPKFLGGPVTARGAAVVLTSEDDADEVHRRLHTLDPSNARRNKPLYVVPMVSAGGARAIVTDGPNGPAPTEFWYALRSQLLAIPDLRLVVLDPLSSFIAADTNDNMIGAAVMAMLGELCATTGATVMVVHHFAKGKTITGLGDARDAIRGASALVDNGRWALALWECEEKTAREILKLLGQAGRSKQSGIVYRGGIAKSNAPAAKTIRTLLRNAKTGLLEDVTETLERVTPRTVEIEEDVLTTLQAIQKERLRFSFPKSGSSLNRQGVWDEVKRRGVDISIDQFEKVVQALIERGTLVQTAAKGPIAYYEPRQD